MNPYIVISAGIGAALIAVSSFFYGQHIKDTEWQVKWEARNAADNQAARDAEQAARNKETEWEKKLEEIQNAGRKNLDEVRQRERDAANSRMRDAIEAARRKAAAEAAATLRSTASPIDVFAELLTRADELAEKFAAEADNSRARGLSCEESYDATK